MLLPDILTPTPTSPRAVLAQFQQRLENLLATGEYTPFVYPYRALGPNILILYLLLPPTKSKVVYYARYPLFVLISYLSVSAIRECRSSMVTVGYGIGLLNAWAVLWSACLVVFNDARGGFARIEEQELGEGEGEGEGEGSLVDGGADDEATTGAEKVVGGELRERLMDWEPKPPESSKRKSNESSSGKPVHHTWQKLPSTFVHRLDWVLDLVQNFRGPRWNYQISGLPPPPLYIQSSLKDLSQPDPNERSYLTRKDILRRDLPSFIMCCVALDAFKTITIQDPYFWSLPSSTPSPLPYPRLSRLVLTLAFTYTSLLTIFLLAPLVFGVLLGPRYIGQHAWPWLYPPYFGPSSQVWKKGLAGLWGGWWHQLFRYAFEQAGEFVGRGVGWEKRSKHGALLRAVVAFCCSGILHACASYTTLGNTRPMSGSFAFFMLQPVGIIVQREVAGCMRSMGWREKIPGWVRGIGNLAVVVGWCYWVGPLVSDDFAATGIWLYEPIPVSVMRGLRGEGWWHWGCRWVSWYSAERWWQSGLAF